MSDVSETKGLYDEWAAQYDHDMADSTQDYVGPATAGLLVLRSLGAAPSIGPDVRILDAGCGTGLVGVQLAKLGARSMDGIDLSPGMLDVARKAGVYRSLDTADLSGPIAHGDASYDVVVCVGTMTQGHVGPQAIDEFVRVATKNGFIVATVLDAIWEDGGYRTKVEGLERDGKVKVLSSSVEDYRRGAGVRARFLVLQVIS